VPAEVTLRLVGLVEEAPWRSNRAGGPPTVRLPLTINQTLNYVATPEA